MIQPFLQPQISVKPRYELLRGLVHVKILLRGVVEHGSNGVRDLHAPLYRAVSGTTATAHPHRTVPRRSANSGGGRRELPPAGMRSARRTPAAAELVLQRRHEGHVRVAWATRQRLVVASHDVVQRLPYVLPTLHHVLHIMNHHLALRNAVLYEEAYETHRFEDLFRHERWPVRVHARYVCHMLWQREVRVSALFHHVM